MAASLDRDAEAARATPATNETYRQYPDLSGRCQLTADRKLRGVRKTGPGWARVVRLTDMLLARWLPAAAITESYAVHEAALFRYSQRGMLGARWDAAAKSWLYDVMRVRELFVHRDTRVMQPSGPTLGTLGETRLAGTGIARRADVRESRQGLSVRGANGTSDDAIDDVTRLTRAS